MSKKKNFIYKPYKWGGITPIWIASYASLLRKHNYKCDLFDCTLQ